MLRLPRRQRGFSSCINNFPSAAHASMSIGTPPKYALIHTHAITLHEYRSNPPLCLVEKCQYAPTRLHSTSCNRAGRTF